LDHFSNQHLHFFYDIDTCLKEYSIDVLLLSSVVQYLENPYSFLNDILKKNIKYILIDRTPIQFSGKDIITIQRVPKNIYKASYPCWVFNEQYILTVLSKEYNLVFETECDERINMNNSYFKAYFFEKKD
ncbi:MAG TPA: methyltransferase, TIGR04325 family, partial [Bacteroidia bacterium]|nr:methyltransferase, TIGR04325 family [Bacteroidia bacterium]